MYEPQVTINQAADFLRYDTRFASVSGWEGVVVERYAVDEGDEQEGPVSAAFRFDDVMAVVNGEEDMSRFREVGERITEGTRVGSLKKHEGHARTQENNVGSFVFGEAFAFEVSSFVSLGRYLLAPCCNVLFPECDYLFCS